MFKTCAGNCKHCQGKHSVALCPELIKDKRIEHTFTTTCVSHTDVLLQTVKVPVKGKKRVVDAIILFDTGSNRTYVSQNFVDKVSPEWIEKQQLSYSSFGAESSSPTENVNIYNMCLQGEKGECSVSATCIKLFVAIYPSLEFLLIC